MPSLCPKAWQGYTAGPPTPQLSWLIWLNAAVRVAAADFLLIRSGHLCFAPFIRRAAANSALRRGSPLRPASPHRQHCDRDALAATLQHRLDNTEELATL